MLNNKYIVRLHELIDSTRNIYIVTEYIGGGELFAYVSKNKRLSEAEACKFFR